ncbi:MAG: hypothetical protein OXH92_03340 [Bryobacterales bacterium]|nr:hypothetical protein [Bryobacterales bacterium]
MAWSSRLLRRIKEAKLCIKNHASMENENRAAVLGLIGPGSALWLAGQARSTGLSRAYREAIRAWPRAVGRKAST